MNKKHKRYSIAAIIAITALALTACDDKPDPDPDPAKNDTITLTGDLNKTITIDYSGSGLTQAQADNNVTPKLEGAFNVFAGLLTGNPARNAFDVMVNKSGFKIVIIPGNSGCARVSDTMTLGADFLLTNDMQNIGNSIQSALMNGIFV